MSSTKINTGIRQGYEIYIDFEALHDTAAKQAIGAAAHLAILGTAGDPETAIADASVDGMGHN